ncbi:Dopamine beta-hydroxylase, partial [Fragariocoptes setiger]
MKSFSTLVFNIIVIFSVFGNLNCTNSAIHDGRSSDGDMTRLISSLSQELPHISQSTSRIQHEHSLSNQHKKHERNGNKDYWQLWLDNSFRYQLFWTYDYDDNYIEFELALSSIEFRPKLDAFALGFTHTTHQELRYRRADLCLIWHDQAGQMHLQHAWLDANSTLRLSSLDVHYKCRFIKARESHDKLSVLFSRILDSCSDIDASNYIITNGTVDIIWFKLNAPLPTLEGFEFGQQSANISKGHVNVRLLAPNRSPIKGYETESYKHTIHNNGRYYNRVLDLTNDKLHVPNRDTTYWCRVFHLSNEFQRKHHVTRYEAIIQEGHEHLVHHMELFHCEANNELEISQHANSWAGSCSDPMRPRQLDSCKRVIVAWAMGAAPFEYPEQVGLAIGGHNYNRYVMLEVHYNNPELRNDFIDSSGLRVHYTNELRDNDAGVLEVGLEYTDKNSVPPGIRTTLAGFCVAECTRVAMQTSLNEPQEGINIFAAQLHTHLTGVKSKTLQARAGRVVRELNRDDHFSPHFQEIRLLPQQVRVLPGDALVHYCLYDTRQRGNVTLGGFAIADEMCVTYLHYYPRINLEVCKSSINTRHLMAYFERAGYWYNDSTLAYNKTVAQNYQLIRWSRARAQELLQLYEASPLSMQCNQSNGERYPGDWNGVETTKLYTYDEPDSMMKHHRWQFDDADEYLKDLWPIERHKSCGLSNRGNTSNKRFKTHPEI